MKRAVNAGARILVVDDDAALRRIIRDRLKARGYETQAVGSGQGALDELEGFDPALLLLDLRMPGMDGFAVLETLMQRRTHPEVIVITAHGTVESAVRAMQMGAADFVPKPFEPSHLETVVAKVLSAQKLKGRVAALERELSAQHTMVSGQSPAMSAVTETATRAARSVANILLLGESGSGKEVLARFVHAESERAEGPFVAVNCATLTGDLMQSELFGHERGAFTGALAAKKGRIEQAQGGTLFLDEVAEFAPEVQAKLLRVIQEREFERVGGTRTQSADVRIIAATHRDLPASIQEGSFREDLYYRLKVVSIQVPPVRERPEDLPDLLQHFLERYRSEAKRSPMSIERGALEKLLAYQWPGNVREVSNVIERAVVLALGDTIHIEDLPEEVRSLSGANAATGEQAQSANLDEASYHDAVLAAKRQILTSALEQHDGHQTNAAKTLGLTQPYMSRLLKSMGLK